METIAE